MYNNIEWIYCNYYPIPVELSLCKSTLVVIFSYYRSIMLAYFKTNTLCIIFLTET